MERYFMNYKEFSKYLSYLLRHNPRDIKLNMNEQGWVDIDELIVNLKKYKGKDTNYEEIKEIVDTDKKGRYSTLDGKIRANQGHSLDFVKIAFKEYKEEKNYKLFKVDFLNVKKLDFKICKNQREDNVLNKTPSFNLNQKRKNFLPLIHKQKHTDNIFQFKPNSIIPRKHRSYSGIPKLIRKNINII